MDSILRGDTRCPPQPVGDSGKIGLYRGPPGESNPGCQPASSCKTMKWRRLFPIYMRCLLHSKDESAMGNEGCSLDSAADSLAFSAFSDIEQRWPAARKDAMAHRREGHASSCPTCGPGGAGPYRGKPRSDRGRAQLPCRLGRFRPNGNPCCAERSRRSATLPRANQRPPAAATGRIRQPLRGIPTPHAACGMGILPMVFHGRDARATTRAPFWRVRRWRGGRVAFRRGSCRCGRCRRRL